MPKRLPQRWQQESICEFRASALERFDDAMALAASNRRSGAIYLWGYSTEMFLKAAYFSTIGKAESDQITFPDITSARTKGVGTFGISWPSKEAGHNLLAWCELLVAERAVTGAPYSGRFAFQVRREGRRINEFWSVSMRYHKNVAYTHEVKCVREAAEWFMVNSDML